MGSSRKNWGLVGTFWECSAKNCVPASTSEEWTESKADAGKRGRKAGSDVTGHPIRRQASSWSSTDPRIRPMYAGDWSNMDEFALCRTSAEHTARRWLTLSLAG